MARLWSSGFELNSVTNLIEITGSNTSGGGAIAISTTTVRSGRYSFRASNTGASGLARAHHIFTASADDGPYYARAYVNIADLPGSLGPILAIWDGATLKASIRLATDGTLELHDSVGKIGSSSSALSLNTWYRIELKYYHTGVNSELDGKLDGTSFASTTSAPSGGTVDRVAWGMASNNTSFDIYFDDIALNDSTGSFQNSFPGAGQIVHLRPNAAGDNSDWSNTYANVDEVTPDDATTIVASNTSGQIDDHNIDEPIMISSDATISLVQIGVRFRIDVQTGADPTFVLRVKASASGTVEESSTISPTLNSWQTNTVANPRNYPFTLYDLPGASTTAWTQADLKTAQIGYKETTTDTHNVNISTLWMLVEYVQGSEMFIANYGNDTDTAASSQTLTLVTPAADICPNPVLLAFALLYDDTNGTDRIISSITYNSDNLTLIGAYDNNSGVADGDRNESWYRINPDVGSNSLVATAGGTCNVISLVGIIIGNANQSTQPDDSDGDDDGTEPSVTTTDNDEYVISAQTAVSGSSSADSGQTELANLQSGFHVVSTTHKLTTGSVTHGYADASETFNIVAIKAITAAGGTVVKDIIGMGFIPFAR